MMGLFHELGIYQCKATELPNIPSFHLLLNQGDTHGADPLPFSDCA